MLETRPPAAHAPESATTALYRAALGPVNTDRCLRVFERFDEAGRASPVWNPAAGLLTLNWMLFRQLWGAALVYGVCLVAVLLIALGLGQFLLSQWPPGVVWGALATFVILSIAIPGAYGHALLHADVRRRMTRAVSEASTLREACATLEKQASTRRRLWVLAALNAVLPVVAGAVLWPAWHMLTMPGGLVERPAVVSAPVETAQEIAQEIAKEVVPVAESQARGEAVAEPQPEPAPAPVVVVVPEVAAQAELKVAPAMPSAPTTQRVQASATGGESSQAHGINVGLFADRANAEKAQARLAEAGFVALLQIVERPTGELTRVRVGPFTGRAQADEAAARIRALGLDAVVFRP